MSRAACRDNGRNGNGDIAVHFLAWDPQLPNPMLPIVTVIILLFVTAERRSSQAGRQHGSIPTPALLHARLRSSHFAWKPAVPRSHRARACAADVRRQEHDGRL